MPVPATTHSLDDRLIYVVDDEQLMLDLAEVALSADGYALKNSRTHKPHLIRSRKSRASLCCC